MSAPVLPAFSSVAIDRAAHVLIEGGLVVVPTDTVYGLAAALSHSEAVEAIYRVKQRPIDKPIALLVDSIEDVESVAASIPAVARALMDQFWPGGLTLILPRRPDVPDVVAAGGPTIAVRMPAHPVPRALARRLGQPLPTTSANKSGKPSPRTAEEAAREIGDEVSLILNAGPAPGGIESTVIDPTRTPPVILREGAISADALAAALGTPVVRA